MADVNNNREQRQGIRTHEHEEKNLETTGETTTSSISGVEPVKEAPVTVERTEDGGSPITETAEKEQTRTKNHSSEGQQPNC